MNINVLTAIGLTTEQYNDIMRLMLEEYEAGYDSGYHDGREDGKAEWAKEND
jgi:hypothetical protein